MNLDTRKRLVLVVNLEQVYSILPLFMPSNAVCGESVRKTERGGTRCSRKCRLEDGRQGHVYQVGPHGPHGHDCLRHTRNGDVHGLGGELEHGAGVSHRLPGKSSLLKQFLVFI